MARMVRVEFNGPARHQYSPAPEYALRAGDVVVVETDWGVGMGDVVAILEEFPQEVLKAPVSRILRKATPTDLARRAALAQREREVRAFCRERIQARGLPMKLTEVRIGLDSSKAMFYFTADGRVDFRELVKDLSQHLRTRVELRQIGVRDEARVLGTGGACGRPLCCRAFLQAFTPVSIRMAKDQNLALNPGKLSGICGRLKCCLAFEHPLYAELKRTLPKPGCCVSTCRGPGLVRAQNILEQTVLIGLETGGQVILSAGEVTVQPRSTSPSRGPHAGEDPAGTPAAGSAPGGRLGAAASAENRRPEGSPPTEDVPDEIAALEDS
ncbi:MAG: hypothetical protein HYY88_05910 [candidate division NC10 bacterium]|nr:hypothetical protein [candidate division NC10 bacterium]